MEDDSEATLPRDISLLDCEFNQHLPDADDIKFPLQIHFPDNRQSNIELPLAAVNH